MLVPLLRRLLLIQGAQWLPRVLTKILVSNQSIIMARFFVAADKALGMSRGGIAASMFSSDTVVRFKSSTKKKKGVGALNVIGSEEGRHNTDHITNRVLTGK